MGQSGSTKKETKVVPLNCFIATAYGSEIAAELDTLRAFRDKVLLKSKPGNWVVSTYYAVSPPMAEYIAEHKEVRTIVREALLNPLVFMHAKSRGFWYN